jgi:hypothetical protein
VLLGFILWLPSWLPGGPAAWFAAAGVLTTAATFGSIALVSRRSLRSAWWIAASPALLLDAGINWDLIGILFMVAAVVWFGEGRYRLSGVATALGTFFKLFPVVAAPMAVAALGSQWWRSLAGSRPTDPGRPSPSAALARWLIPFVVVSVVVMVPFLMVARSNTLYFFRFNSARPSKDSIWVVLDRVAGASFLSNHAVNTLSLLVVMAALAYGAWMVWRAPTPEHSQAMALATAMALIAWMAVNKVWNPQYVLWVFAAAALVSMPARYGVALGILSVWDWGFEFVLRLPERSNAYTWAGYAASVARTVLFALMIAWVIGRLRQLLVTRVPPLVGEAPVRTPA